MIINYVLLKLLTTTTEQGPSWVATRFSASQEIPRILWNRRFITAFTRTRHMYLFWASSIQCIPPSNFLEIYFYINLKSTTWSSKLSLSLRSLHQDPMHFSCLSFEPHALPISLFEIWSRHIIICVKIVLFSACLTTLKMKGVIT